jgi:hypothetical protein
MNIIEQRISIWVKQILHIFPKIKRAYYAHASHREKLFGGKNS